MVVGERLFKKKSVSKGNIVIGSNASFLQLSEVCIKGLHVISKHNHVTMLC